MTGRSSSRAGDGHDREGPGTWVEILASAVDSLNDCDGYVVVVTDRGSGEADAYGPLAGVDALDEADRVGRDLRAQGLSSVTVEVVRLHLVDAPTSKGPAPVRRPADGDAEVRRP